MRKRDKSKDKKPVWDKLYNQYRKPGMMFIAASGVMFDGVPRVAGTRVLVWKLLEQAAAGKKVVEIARMFHLTKAQVEYALNYARHPDCSHRMSERYEDPVQKALSELCPTLARKSSQKN